MTYERRETIDGYTLEDSYWTGNFYEVEDELEQQARLEYLPKVWKEYGDMMEDALAVVDRIIDGVL